MAGVFLYHIKKTGFVGERLYPLNSIKDALPEVYAREAKKYEGREWLMDVAIPGLDVRWNDVLHFSLMHPSVIFNELSAHGFTHHKVSREWFEVPVADIMAQPAVLYKNMRKDRSSRVYPASEFEAVSEARVKELSGMPARNRDYYEECFGQKSYPLLWAFAPHVLLKGSLDVSGYRVFDWLSD